MGFQGLKKGKGTAQPAPAKGETTSQIKDTQSSQVVAEQKEQHEVEVPEEVYEGAPADARWAQIEVRLGQTVGLPNFSSLRVDVGLTIHAPQTEEGLEQGAGFATEWCKAKIAELLDEGAG